MTTGLTTPFFISERERERLPIMAGSILAAAGVAAARLPLLRSPSQTRSVRSWYLKTLKGLCMTQQCRRGLNGKTCVREEDCPCDLWFHLYQQSQQMVNQLQALGGLGGVAKTPTKSMLRVLTSLYYLVRSRNQYPADKKFFYCLMM